jgi:peptide chain release factor subunit 1
MFLLEEKILHLTQESAKDSSLFHDKKTGVMLDVVDSVPLLEWLANNYKRFGARLEFVTNKSQEGSQFCKGFGGIGGNFVATTDASEQHCCGRHEVLVR